MVSERFYTQKEVLSEVGIRHYMLRYWESEFVQIHPHKCDDGSVVYSKKDLLFIKKIKELLLLRKLSLPKAKHLIDCYGEELLNQRCLSEVLQNLQQLKHQLAMYQVEYQDL